MIPMWIEIAIKLLRKDKLKLQGLDQKNNLSKIIQLYLMYLKRLKILVNNRRSKLKDSIRQETS